MIAGASQDFGSAFGWSSRSGRVSAPSGYPIRSVVFSESIAESSDVTSPSMRPSRSRTTQAPIGPEGPTPMIAVLAVLYVMEAAVLFSALLLYKSADSSWSLFLASRHAPAFVGAV